MAEGSLLGLLILLGIVAAVILIPMFNAHTDVDESERDLDHLDHEARGDEFER